MYNLSINSGIHITNQELWIYINRSYSMRCDAEFYQHTDAKTTQNTIYKQSSASLESTQNRHYEVGEFQYWFPLPWKLQQPSSCMFTPSSAEEVQLLHNKEIIENQRAWNYRLFWKGLPILKMTVQPVMVGSDWNRATMIFGGYSVVSYIASHLYFILPLVSLLSVVQ